MFVLFQVILLLLYVLHIHAALLPQKPPGLWPAPISPVVNFNRTLLTDMTFQDLVANDCLLTIEYWIEIPLLNPQYKSTLARAQLVAEQMRAITGSLQRVPNGFRIVVDNVKITAQSFGEASSQMMTIGILDEAMGVLQNYMPTRPYKSTIYVYHGRSRDFRTHGLPIGRIKIYNQAQE